MAIIYALLSMVFWGLALFLAAFASRKIGNILTLFWMQFFYSKMSVFPKSGRLPMKLLIFIGIFDILAFFSYSLGVSSGYGSIVAPISSANTLVTIFLGLVFLKEKVGTRQVIGISAIVGGLILISI